MNFRWQAHLGTSMWKLLFWIVCCGECEDLDVTWCWILVSVLNETQMWVEGCECCFCEPRLQYKYSENTNTSRGVSVAENGGIDTLWGRKARRRRRGQRNVTRRRWGGCRWPRQWLLTFANDTNTIVRKQLQVGFIGNMLANSDDLDHLYLHVL